MCAGGIVRSGLGRGVYALSNEQFAGIGLEPDRPAVRQDGPALSEEARIPLGQYYRRESPDGAEPGQPSCLSVSTAISGRDALHVGQRAPWPGTFSQ